MMNVFQNGNAFGDPERARPDWTEDLDFEVPDARDEPVEFLWYVGDYPSYDERNRAAPALARVFEAADVDYGILYEDERTRRQRRAPRRRGGPLRDARRGQRRGDADCEFETIVTTDPHAYNTFMNEYPEFEACEWGEDDVFHYTQVVADLASAGALGLAGTELDFTVTYRDPCHLGRYIGEFEAPRDLIRATGADLHEMPRNRDDSFCCGGGGGGLWMDHDEESKPSEERLREALDDTTGGVERFVVACPMCATMYEDGRKTGDYEEASKSSASQNCWLRPSARAE